MTKEFLVGRGPRYGGKFDLRKGFVGALLLPEGETVGGYVFSDKGCKVCFVFLQRRNAVVLVSLSIFSFPRMPS